ncbi:hypothetical protein EBZ80_01920 [bacterium]|nr:hypothetical protein [bacterium]
MNLILVPLSALCLFRGLRDALEPAVAAGHMDGLLDSYEITEQSVVNGCVLQDITYQKSIRAVLPGWVYDRIPADLRVERFRQKTYFDEKALVMTWEVTPAAQDPIFAVCGNTIFEDAPNDSARVTIKIDITLALAERLVPAFIQKILEKIVPPLILADQRRLFHRLISFLEKTSDNTGHPHRTSTHSRNETTGTGSSTCFLEEATTL